MVKRASESQYNQFTTPPSKIGGKFSTSAPKFCPGVRHYHSCYDSVVLLIYQRRQMIGFPATGFLLIAFEITTRFQLICTLRPFLENNRHLITIIALFH